MIMLSSLHVGIAGRKAQHLLDLYSGTGTIALSLASCCKSVTGAESVASAVADAKANAKQNGITNARFVRADLSRADGLKQIAAVRPDVVVAGESDRPLPSNPTQSRRTFLEGLPVHNQGFSIACRDPFQSQDKAVSSGCRSALTR